MTSVCGQIILIGRLFAWEYLVHRYTMSPGNYRLAKMEEFETDYWETDFVAGVGCDTILLNQTMAAGLVPIV